MENRLNTNSKSRFNSIADEWQPRGIMPTLKPEFRRRERVMIIERWTQGRITNNEIYLALIQLYNLNRKIAISPVSLATAIITKKQVYDIIRETQALDGDPVLDTVALPSNVINLRGEAAVGGQPNRSDNPAPNERGLAVGAPSPTTLTSDSTTSTSAKTAGLQVPKTVGSLIGFLIVGGLAWTALRAKKI